MLEITEELQSIKKKVNGMWRMQQKMTQSDFQQEESLSDYDMYRPVPRCCLRKLKRCCPNTVHPTQEIGL